MRILMLFSGSGCSLINQVFTYRRSRKKKIKSMNRKGAEDAKTGLI
jgi:hypothetical protein